LAGFWTTGFSRGSITSFFGLANYGSKSSLDVSSKGSIGMLSLGLGSGALI